MVNLLLAIIYLAFISLGLPDGLLGAGWPSMYKELNVPMSYAGIVSMIIAAGTVVSSLFSDALTKKLGTGKVTLISVLLTALALFGFAISNSFWMLCLFAIPYGLGAGSVDASINNYAALHYKSYHMSWLHCMWGVGAAIGPYVMGLVLTKGKSWHYGYGYIGIVQIILTLILLFSLPLWKNKSEINTDNQEKDESKKGLSLKQIINIPGVKAIMIIFFCYCSLESISGLWASSYLVLHHNIDSDLAASYASMFYIGITIGRGLCGFLTFKLNDTKMIRLGTIVIAIGSILLMIPLGNFIALLSLILVGLGCAPVYPCLIHSTPIHFGKTKSQAIIGVQMASAYVGTCLMPPLFGLLANNISITLFPFVIFTILVLMVIMHEKLVKKNKKIEKQCNN